MFMIRLFLAALLSVSFSLVNLPLAHGQLAPERAIPNLPDSPLEKAQPEIPQDLPIPEALPKASPSEPPDETSDKSALSDQITEARPDILITSEADRAQKLESLFQKLAQIEDEAEANLVAEEIWAVWLYSGSASIDYVLARGNSAMRLGDIDLAARMYDNVIRLQPTYAEGWIRSGRLALENKELGRAMAELTQGLIYEPRHFYGLWSLGNLFEQLGQNEEAFEAYNEALKVYPALKAVKDRVAYLAASVEGEAL